jgi:uncharacterized damage-inducible protein DinB
MVMNESDALREQVYGVNSHMNVLHALEGLDPALAGQRVPGAPHTIFQILHHMIYWQDLALARMHGANPESPKSSVLGWRTSEAPEDPSDWEAAVACLAEGLRSLEEILIGAEDLGRTADAARKTSLREEILMVQGHNSYHLGQIVMLRHLLGSWPPPRGRSDW